MRGLGSSFRGAAVRLGLGVVLFVALSALVLDSDEASNWVVVVVIVVGNVAAGLLLRGAGTFLDAAWFRLRRPRDAPASSGTHRLAIRDVSPMPRIQAIYVLRKVGLTFDDARAAVDGGAAEFLSPPVSRRDAEQAARAARRYGAEARAEPVDGEQPAEP